MSQSLQSFVVSIRHQTHRTQIAGTGFVVDDRHILTCAHVITKAGAAPGDTVRVVFAVPREAGRNQPRAQAVVLPDFWRDAAGDDMAVLQLTGEQLPEGVAPAQMASAAYSRGHRFAAFGYPQVGGDIKGFPADGVILGDAPRARGGSYLALRSQEIAQGMSGAPVLDTEIDRVVGMITNKTDRDIGTFRDAGMATPIDHMQTIWPALRLTPAEPVEARQPSASTPIPPLPPHFQGRDTLIADLVLQLTSGEAVALSADGKPGVGKTTLAVALARDAAVRAHFNGGVLWTSLGPDGDPMRVLGQWADALGQDISNIVELADRQQAVTRLIGNRQMLLVIDDAWRWEQARWLRCGGERCVHLLTTRDQGLARQFAGANGQKSVPELAEDPAFALLQVLAPEACAVDPAAARGLANAVGGLPLALELLGGYLAAPERHFFPDLSAAALAEMADPARRLQLAAARLGGRGDEVTLAETIGLSLDGLTDPARDAFYALGAFAPKPATFNRVAAEAVAQTDGATLAQLGAANLLELVDGELTLHQTLADTARNRVFQKNPVSLAEAQQRHRTYYLTLANEDREKWQRIEAAYPQIQWAWDHAEEDESLVTLIFALGIYHQRRGLWREYVIWAKRAIEVAEHNDLRKDLGTLCNNIGSVYDSLGQREKALDFYNRALPILMDVGNRYVESITRYNMAMIFRAWGQLAEAVAQLEQVVALDRLVQHPDLESDAALLAQLKAELAAQSDS